MIIIELKDLSLKDITPSSLQKDTNIQGIIAAVDPELQEITGDIPQASVISQTQTFSDDILDHIAWQNHTDFYELAKSTEMKRDAIKSALKLHMKKGTVWAIKEALRLIDIEAEFVPWWEFDGSPYTFGLDGIIAGDFYRNEGRDILMQSILKAVNETKSARSAMVSLVVTLNDEAECLIYAGVAPYVEGFMTVALPYEDTTHICGIFAGVAPYVQGEIDINPCRPEDTSEASGVYIGTARVVEGEIDINARRPDDTRQTAGTYAGIARVYRVEGAVDYYRGEYVQEITQTSGIIIYGYGNMRIEAEIQE